MRRIWLGLAIALTMAACAQQPPAPGAVEASGSSGAPGHLALRGQVMITHPPGTEDAAAVVRREAAGRCPNGFTIRSLHTAAPATGDFTVGLLNYQAVVDCSAPIAD
jgi:hypothetical protein